MVALLVGLYILIGVTTALVVSASAINDGIEDGDRHPMAFFGGLLWPLLLSAITLYSLAVFPLRGFERASHRLAEKLR